jgi:hypothetical protein
MPGLAVGGSFFVVSNSKKYEYAYQDDLEAINVTGIQNAHEYYDLPEDLKNEQTEIWALE